MAQEAVLPAGQGWRAPACPARPPALAVIAREMTLRRGGAVQIWLASERPGERRCTAARWRPPPLTGAPAEAYA